MSLLVDAPTPSVVHPPAPANLAEAGLTLDLVVQLVVKTLHFAGELTGSDIAADRNRVLRRGTGLTTLFL